ncbi:MAG: hypothetical protein Pars2KO_00440 [Parasphingorhabdus sp.]
MKQTIESFRNSQSALLSALDGHDSDAIFKASRDLKKAASKLSCMTNETVDHSLLPAMSEVDEMMQASIYRLRFLRDHSSTRLQLLSGWRDGQANIYSDPSGNR